MICVTFTVSKTRSNIDFMICDKYGSNTFGKLKFVKKMNIFSNAEGTAYNLLYSSVTHRTCTNACILVHK